MSDGKVGQCTHGVTYSGQCRVELQWLGKGKKNHQSIKAVLVQFSQSSVTTAPSTDQQRPAQ